MRYVRPEDEIDPQLLQLQYRGRLWPVRLLHATTDERRASAGHNPHIHEVYHIVLYTAGTNQFIIEGRGNECRPGTLVLCPPGIPHDFGPQLPGETSYHEISFELANGPDYLLLQMHEMLSLFLQREISPLPLTDTRPVWLERLAPLMASVVTEAVAGALTSLFRAHVALANVFAALVEGHAHRTSHATDPVEAAHKRISLEFANPISIVKLAADLGVSHGYLCRRFQERYGVSPLQLRQTMRLAAAERLLQTSSLSCKEVAARLGFADVQTFTKAFVRHRGRTPGSLAKAARTKPAASRRR